MIICSGQRGTNGIVSKPLAMPSASSPPVSVILRTSARSSRTGSAALGVSVSTVKTMIDGKPMKFIIVVTAGKEFFGKLKPSIYRRTYATMILFDKGDSKSFERSGDLFNEIKQDIARCPSCTCRD